MDYDYILNKVFAKAEYFIIKQFKIFKADDRTYTYSIDKICGIISTKTFYSFLGRNRNIFENCQRIFNNPQHYYTKEVPLSKIINNEIKEEFNKTLKHQKPVDSRSHEIENYKFSSFVYELIVNETLMKIERRLRQNNDLYKLIYESEEYASITLESFDGHVINSILYQKLYAKVYPNEKKPVATGSINQYGNKEWKIFINDDPIELELISKPDIVKILQQDFDSDEQLLILNLCLVDNNAIPLTEKIKLLTLIGELKDKSIFTEQSSKNTAYSKVNKGILRKGSVSTMILTIDNIQIKIEKYILPLTQQTLKKHRSTLISEQKKQKHT